MPQPTDLIQKFSRIGLITILAVYLLIFVGGVVRASGSGMGCPGLAHLFWQADTADPGIRIARRITIKSTSGTVIRRSTR